MTLCVDVIGVGANSVDFVSVLPHYPQPEGPWAKMRVCRQAIYCGGQTATALAACASLGLSTRYVGVTGTDESGRRIREELGRRGVDTTHVVTRDAGNQSAVILIDERTGERIVLWNRDDRLDFREGELPEAALGPARVVHVDDVDERAATRAARIAREGGAAVTSDIDRLTDCIEELVAAVSFPIFAEHVPLQLAGESDIERALRRLGIRHRKVLTVTLGARGAIALDGDRIVRAPGFEVEAVDTTGAGDVFRGGFIYALLQGWSIDRILRFANAAAALSCTRAGAMDGVPSLAEVEALVARTAGRGEA